MLYITLRIRTLLKAYQVIYEYLYEVQWMCTEYHNTF